MIPDGLRKVWRALSGSVPLVPLSDAYDRFGFYQRIGSEDWSPALRTEVLRALEPCIEVQQAWSSVIADLDGEASAEADCSVGSVLSFDCELEAGQALQMMLEDLRRRPDWTSILADIAFDLGGLLRRALDLHAALDAATADHDPSYIEHPSIGPHPQNRDFHGWTTLIELVREAFEALKETDLVRARALVRSWHGVPYPLFRRLQLYAARSDGVTEPSILLRTIQSDPERWMWSVEIQVEFFGSLSWLWEGLEASGRASLVSLLLQGPPRKMFRLDLTPEEWHDVRDHSTWERLARLHRTSAGLEGEAAERLTEIEAGHPAWRLSGEDREDFPTWMESGWGLPSDFSVENLLALSDEDLIQVLREHQANREGLIDSWRRAAEQDRSRAIRLLDHLREDQFLDTPVWSQGLAALRELDTDTGLRQQALDLLESLPQQLLAESAIVRAVADLVRALSKDVTDALRSSLLAIWDAVLPASFSVASMETDERVTEAINHPTGVLTEAILLVLRSRPLERGAGIDEDVRVRLEQVAASSEATARLGRVLVASRLSLLHDLDAEWTRQKVVPLLDWSDPEEAKGAWQGFLWSPWVRPSLWEAIKAHFLAAFDHLDALGRSEPNLAAILASISIEGQDAISPLEAAECLRRLDDGGRENVLIWICRKLQGAQAQAASLWREQIQPWLNAAWPREPELRGSGASTRLAWAATLAGEAFVEAATCVAELVGPIERGRLILDSLEERGLVQVSPEACLELMNALTPREPPHWFGDLRIFLDRIREANPPLEADARFRRLNEIAIQTGI